MVMTHYMELLSLHSPWFLILFMAVPVVFIETIFMAEAFSLLGSGKEREKWQTLSHRGGLFFSLYFIVAALYLVTRYIPTIEWRAHRPYRGLGLCPWHHPRLPASFHGARLYW